MNDAELSQAIEALLVSRNPRQMQLAGAALTPGYYLRGAQTLRSNGQRVLIGTGFPVAGTFETDGPLGAIALYEALETLGGEPWLASGPPLCTALEERFRVLPLCARTLPAAEQEAVKALDELKPTVVLSIEHPGINSDGCYYNMRGEDISDDSAIFDPFLALAPCPTIAIGDGGNEIGMGNISELIAELDIPGSGTTCNELLVADVSNWGAYGLISLLGYWSGQDLLGAISPLSILQFLSARGSVDGVTRENTLTEDGLPLTEGASVIRELRRLTGFSEVGSNGQE